MVFYDSNLQHPVFFVSNFLLIIIFLVSRHYIPDFRNLKISLSIFVMSLTKITIISKVKEISDLYLDLYF